jgi:hypothetical protein
MPPELRQMSDRLRWLRETKFGPRGRAAIAQLAGVTGNTWKAYEERGTVPSAEVIARLSQAVPELNALWLLTGSGEPFGNPERPIDVALLPSDVLIVELRRRNRKKVNQATDMLEEARRLDRQLDELEEAERNRKR